MQQLPKQSTEASEFDMNQVHPLYFLESDINENPAIAHELTVSVTVRPMHESFIEFWDLFITYDAAENNFRADYGKPEQTVYYGFHEEIIEFLTRYVFCKSPKWAKEYKALCAEIERETKTLPY